MTIKSSFFDSLHWVCYWKRAVSQLGLVVPGLFVLAVLAGCSSKAVIEHQLKVSEQIARPDRVIVYDFAATLADIPLGSALAIPSIDRPALQTEAQIEAGRKLGAQVAKNLVKEIRRMGLPAVQAAGQPAPGIGDLLIRGYFVSIKQDKNGGHVLLGIGPGAIELRTAAEGDLKTVQSLGRQGAGQVGSGGGKTPAMEIGFATVATTRHPIGLIVSKASQLEGEENGSETIEEAAPRIAKEIAEQLWVKFREQGWV